MSVIMDAETLNRFMMEEFPQVAPQFRVERVAPMEADVRLMIGEQHLRPGGTVSGPSMFALADLAMYAVLLAMIGPVALAVTTNASIDLMRKPEAGRGWPAWAEFDLLGKTLAVGDVLIANEGAEAVLARSSMTYAIPPRR